MKTTIKDTFKKIWLLYRNFIHWNISKLLYSLYWVVLWLVILIPFLLVYYIYISIYWGEFMTFITAFRNWVFLWNTFENILHIIALFFYTISFYFSYMLYIKLYDLYLKWKKIAYIENDFLNYKMFWKYLLMTILLIILILVIPVLIYILLFYLMVELIWWTQAATMLALSESSWTFVLITLFSFVLLILFCFYLFFRFVFSYFLLVLGEDNKKSIISLLKNSFIITKWIKKFFNFLLVIFITLLAYLPFYALTSALSINYDNLNWYASYLSLNDEQKEIFKSQYSTFPIEELELKYMNISNEDIIFEQKIYYYTLTILSIIWFLFVSWVFIMILQNFYNNLIKN